MTRTFSSKMRCCGLGGGAIRLPLPYGNRCTDSIDVVDRLAVGSFSYGHSKAGQDSRSACVFNGRRCEC
jgi:hypothetical protein